MQPKTAIFATARHFWVSDYPKISFTSQVRNSPISLFLFVKFVIFSTQFSNLLKIFWFLFLFFKSASYPEYLGFCFLCVPLYLHPGHHWRSSFKIAGPRNEIVFIWYFTLIWWAKIGEYSLGTVFSSPLVISFMFSNLISSCWI